MDSAITVSNQIIEVLEYLCEKFGIVVDWTSESLFPIFEQLMEKYIKWEIARSTVWSVMSIAVIIGGIILIKHGIKIKNNPRAVFLEETGWFVGGGFAIAIGLIVFMITVLTIVKCIAFPELQSFEYVQNLIVKIS